MPRMMPSEQVRQLALGLMTPVDSEQALPRRGALRAKSMPRRRRAPVSPEQLAPGPLQAWRERQPPMWAA
jgi:hypothetical protein